MILIRAYRAALLAACLSLASAAHAAAPDSIDVEMQAPEAASAPVIFDYALETEMVVRDWVLCVSAPFAEELARARAAGIESARSAYEGLAVAHSCGRFPELRVILKEKLSAAADDAGHEARVFGGRVNLSGAWADVFLVSGGLSEE